jgi:hypothetical protein
MPHLVLPLDSCVNVYHASGAINHQKHAVLDHGRSNRRTNHARDAVFPRNNRRVAEDATRVGHYGADSRE